MEFSGRKPVGIIREEQKTKAIWANSIKQRKKNVEKHYPKKIKIQKGALVGEDFTNSGKPNHSSAELPEMQPIL